MVKAGKQMKMVDITSKENSERDCNWLGLGIKLREYHID
jgi:molybdenum cofactor biosynthesis enzyme